jgi:phage terminase small subunit
MNKLSPKQEKFVQEYIKSGNATQSYLNAGYSTKSPDVGASQLLRNNRVQERLEELKNASTKKFIIDKEFLTEKYLEIHNIALEGNINVSKGALDSLARMYGVNEPEKLDVTTQGDKINQIDMTKLSEETLKDLANATKPKD